MMNNIYAGQPGGEDLETLTYTEPDNNDNSRKIVIRIWPYLPSYKARNSAKYPALYQ